MKAMNMAKWMVAAACMSLASANAITITLTVDPNLPPGTTPFVLGAANPGAPASPADDVVYIDGILSLPLGGTGTAGADAVYRSLNVFSGLPTSVSGLLPVTGPGNQTQLTLPSGYAFLAAKYDGPNGGTEVWYVGGMAAGTIIDIPAFGFGNANNQYGLSGTVFLQGNGTQTVPDGGSTVLLLGTTLAGLGAIARRFRK